MKVFLSDFLLQVSLSIEILGLYVADAVTERALQQDHVTREALILRHLDNITNKNVLANCLTEVCVPFGADQNSCLILLLVLPTALVVLKDVFDHGDAHD